MFDFSNWYKEHEFEFTREELRLFKEFINGKISAELVAQSFIKNINGTKGIRCALDVKSEPIISLAIGSLDSAIQEKLINLVLEIRDIQKRSLNPRKKITYYTKLFRMEVIGDWWESYWSISHDPDSAEEYPLWISLNEFCARLTKADICDESKNAANLCNSLLENHKLDENSTNFDFALSDIAQTLRKHPPMFATAISAAAQYMIHAALNLYTFCEGCRTPDSYLVCHWDDWKTVFKEASTIENIQARNDAHSAVVAMDSAERLYISSQMQQITTTETPKQLK